MTILHVTILNSAKVPTLLFSFSQSERSSSVIPTTDLSLLPKYGEHSCFPNPSTYLTLLDETLSPFFTLRYTIISYR